MTGGPALYERHRSDVEALQLASLRDLHVADVWLRGHGVESAHRHPAVASRGLLVPTGAGDLFTVATLGQWLVRCFTTGRFTVVADDEFHALHQRPTAATAQ